MTKYQMMLNSKVKMQKAKIQVKSQKFLAFEF